ncbi:Canalicular multispecific organic anion transporter 1 [Tyrophagus putrescentiae]|nr:Canalicular multispecific organic anion transporter 1 [Tyrophagus putrescentiae]
MFQQQTAQLRTAPTCETTASPCTACSGLSQGLIFLFGAVAFALGTLNSSVTMHRRLLARIMHSPMRFFDTTPSGRVANVFSKDIDALDVAIPLNLNAFAIYLLQVLATIVLICVNVPLFLVVIGPIVLLYYFIQKFYVPTSRQLKRLESITRSPIFSHFSETLSGVSTIRAFGATSAFIGESHRRVDANLRCFYPKFIANRWLAFRLKLVGNLIVLFSAIFAVHSRDAFRDAPGFVGLIMTYSLSLTQILNWLVRQSSDLEANAVSVERIEEYCSEGMSTGRRKGAIEFEDVSVRYRPGLELVLKGVSLVIDAGQKVGVCGRTGSGKSTLTLALFRILEADQGRITIDGVDISRIGLHELRHCLAIIPQDSVLFSGTIRSNLDPFGEYADAELWRALELCHLKQYVTEDQSTDHQHHQQQQQKIAGNGLDYPVSENGANLSVGMRQLLCLGRALLKNSKILVLDEATAAIDLETDALIQATIRREFAHCTVITIAHRLITILDADKILVLEQGRVAEFDTPGALLARPTSQFYSLARDAGIV